MSADTCERCGKPRRFIGLPRCECDEVGIGLGRLTRNGMNFEPYEFCFDERVPPWAMDRRHIEMLHKLAMEVPLGGVVVEIGSYRGASTAAFVEALRLGREFELHLVEPRPTPELRRVIEMGAQSGSIFLHERTSEGFRIPGCNLWFIDGDHGWPAVADCLNGLVSEAEVIAMHDTRAFEHGFKDCGGAYEAARALRAHCGRVWTEDAEVREGEWTHRGFGWSRMRI